MSDDHRKSKRYKNILSWFISDSPSSRRSGSERGSNTRNTENSANDIFVSPSSFISLEECQNERVEINGDIDINSLEHDPGKRLSIWKYPLNERDNFRRAYVALGPFQPELSEYPSCFDGNPTKHIERMLNTE
ncbi:hypothetical protein M0R45_025379 [Rubus argutus]|uniref:Uncharacterized protein n=1 Tax=Rubus argutus TaxID=59490 RepID=A0AAW1WVI5_RUBAR